MKTNLIFSFILSFVCLSLSGTQTKDSLITPQYGFYSTRPAKVWEESLVSGNGTMGAMVKGEPFRESIVVNHALLYLPIHQPLKPVSQGARLAEIKELMLQGKYAEASQLVVDLSHAEGYGDKRWTDPFIPAFRVEIESDSSRTTHYARQVNFETGEVEVKWEGASGAFCRQLFVSRADSVIVIRIRAMRGEKIHSTFALSPIKTCDKWWQGSFLLDDKNGISKVESVAANQALSYRAYYEKPWDGSFKGYEGMMRVVNRGGFISLNKDRIVVNGADEVLLFIRVQPSLNMNQSQLPAISRKLSALSPDYDRLLESHFRIHGDLYHRVRLDLNASPIDRQRSSDNLITLKGSHPALVEKLFDASRYNVLSAIGTNPPNLQGIWGETMAPFWSGDYTTNGNLPVALSHLLQANTPELMLPLFARLESFMDDFRTNARELFNCRGIHVPSRFSTHGLNNHFDVQWPMTFWTAGAAWYSLFYYDYYLYTGDKKFLEERALPFMLESVLFYEDFLEKGVNGKYIFNPSYSPENNPKNNHSQACINATMDVMAANSLLQTLIAACYDLNVYPEKVKVWKKMLEDMPSYEINEEGEIREWMWPGQLENHEHRHASHLFGLYDLADSLIIHNPVLAEGCRRAINKRMEVRRRDNGGVMAFGMMHLAFSACNLQDKESAYDILQWLGSSYWNNNLVSTHDPKSIFNVDISGGYPSLIMKMLVYSEKGYIHLLPCVPADWKVGAIEGVALRGGIRMSKLEWNGGQVKVKLFSPINQKVRISLDGRKQKEVVLRANQNTLLTYNLTTNQHL